MEHHIPYPPFYGLFALPCEFEPFAILDQVTFLYQWRAGVKSVRQSGDTIVISICFLVSCVPFRFQNATKHFAQVLYEASHSSPVISSDGVTPTQAVAEIPFRLV